MNGKVWCESEVGKGATFIVELPSEEANFDHLNSGQNFRK